MKRFKRALAFVMRWTGYLMSGAGIGVVVALYGFMAWWYLSRDAMGVLRVVGGTIAGCVGLGILIWLVGWVYEWATDGER